MPANALRDRESRCLPSYRQGKQSLFIPLPRTEDVGQSNDIREYESAARKHDNYLADIQGFAA